MDKSTSVLCNIPYAPPVTVVVFAELWKIRTVWAIVIHTMTEDPGALWQAVLGEIELSISHGNFVTWFKNTQLVQLTDDSIVIGVINVFAKEQLSIRYNKLIEETLQKNGITPKTIEYKITASARPKADIDEAVVLPRRTQRTAVSSNQVSLDSFGASTGVGQTQVHTTGAPVGTVTAPAPNNSLVHSYRQGINDRYRFDNFVVGAGNELAFAACQAIAQNPGNKYNPLFLYGGVGIGKTHLIQAVGNAILEQNPQARVLYIGTEQFVQEFVDALRFRKTTDFASYYRTADLLIVDDIQFIAGKEKIQEEFFHTFNALHQGSKQIILTSDRPPGEIPTLEDRLRSRFAWGMSIDMQIPDYETRCAIVQTKAISHGTQLSTEVVDYLATNIQTNIRELEGALNQLLAFCEMRELEPNLALATSLLGSSSVRPKHLSAKQIIERTARHFQIPVEDMLGPKRDKDIVVPRQVAMYMLRSELKLSFPKIAKELGRKDHTTAIHSVEKIEKERHIDPSIRTALAEIKEHLYA